MRTRLNRLGNRFWRELKMSNIDPKLPPLFLVQNIPVNYVIQSSGAAYSDRPRHERVSGPIQRSRTLEALHLCISIDTDSFQKG